MNQINLKEIKHPIEKRAFWTLFVFALPIWAAIIVSLVMSIAGIFILLFIVLVGWIVIRLLRAYLLGNSVKVTPENFPEVYNTTEEIKKQLGYDKPIEVYIIYSPILNAFTTVFRGTRIVVLLSEVVESFTEDDIKELKYLLGHEIGHIVAGHFSIWARMVWIFRWIPVIFNWYSRGCEYTADRIGHITSGDINSTVSAITKFVVGNKLSKKVNLELLRKQAEEVRYTLSGRYSELFSTHPYLVKRIVELERYAKGEESFAKAGAKDLKFSLIILIPAILLSGAVIIGIFAAIAIPNFMQARDKALIASAEQAVGTIRKAEEMYMTDNDKYTDRIEDLAEYTNITSLLKSLEVGSLNIKLGYDEEGYPSYEITAKAKDRKHTEIIATPDKVEALESESGKSMENELKDSAYYNNRGITYFEKGDYEKAIADFTTAIELDPKNAAAYSNRGYVYFDLQKYNDAIKDFKKAIELDKNYKDAYCGLAITYYRLGDKEKAKQNYKKAIELDKRYAGEIDELVKEGYFYSEPQLQAIKELLKEIGY